MVDTSDFVLGDLAISVAADGGVTNLDFAGVNFAESDTTQVIAIIEVGDQQLESFARLGPGRWDMLHDGLKQGLHRGRLLSEFELCIALFGRAVDERKVELFVSSVQRHEQLEHLVQHFLRVGVFAINLVNDHDRLGTGFQGFAENEPGLCLRTFRGVDNEEYPVDHVHDALDLTTEVSVSRGIDDVDVVIFVLERCVLGPDSDALLLFQVHRVHEALDLGFRLV